jgi:hypothetical protein
LLIAVILDTATFNCIHEREGEKERERERESERERENERERERGREREKRERKRVCSFLIAVIQDTATFNCIHEREGERKRVCSLLIEMRKADMMSFGKCLFLNI